MGAPARRAQQSVAVRVATKSPEERIADLESLVERMQRCPTLRHELIRGEAGEIEARKRADRMKLHRSAEPARKRQFGRFIDERCELDPDSKSAEFAVHHAYTAWLAAANVAGVESMTQDEFKAAMLALDGIESVRVQAGPLTRPMKGYRGVCVKLEFRHKHDVFESSMPKPLLPISAEELEQFKARNPVPAEPPERFRNARRER